MTSTNWQWYMNKSHQVEVKRAISHLVAEAQTNSAMQPSEPSDGIFAVRNLMANGSTLEHEKQIMLKISHPRPIPRFQHPKHWSTCFSGEMSSASAGPDIFHFCGNPGNRNPAAIMQVSSKALLSNVIDKQTMGWTIISAKPAQAMGEGLAWLGSAYSGLQASPEHHEAGNLNWGRISSIFTPPSSSRLVLCQCRIHFAIYRPTDKCSGGGKNCSGARPGKPTSKQTVEQMA
ncbi:hypothetical protein B0H11DRAFT_1946402 [Mycena galericulata]|nr:hypothetical protein B0H11DRAFT_1946402 [Mycena galericulata]